MEEKKFNIKKILLGVLCFLVPMVGIIFFFIKKKEDMPVAKMALYCGLAGFALNLLVYCSGDEEEYYEDDSYTVSSSYSDGSSVSNNSRPSGIVADFRSETDVRSFLCRYTFVDGSGDRISFCNMGNQLEMNGTPMTTLLTVQKFSGDDAELAFQGPFGRSRFYLVVEDGQAGLMDRNDMSIYYAK